MTSSLSLAGRLTLTLTVLAACVVALGSRPAASAADEAPVTLSQSPAVKQVQIEQVWQGARRHQARQLEKRQGVKVKSGTRALKPGLRSRRPALEDEITPQARVAPARRAEPQQALAVPSNVLVNNRAADAVNAGQAEQHAVVDGNFGLAAWNDGQGFVAPPDVQGWGYTTDGGATWIDTGVPTKIGAIGGVINDWSSDPIVGYDPSNGRFWYCGLGNFDGGLSNGVALAPVTFPAGIYTPGAPTIAYKVANASNLFLDKPWFVVDPTNGYLYVTVTTFDFNVGTDYISFVRSTDGGATWSAPMQVSDPADDGAVQGSRPEVDGAGTIHVTWNVIGPIDVDFVGYTRSTDGGATWSAPVHAATHYDAFLNGAPGFNRARAVTNPGIAVDRTAGPYANRVYLTWHESVNFYNDPLGGSGSKSEVESNNTAATATIFTVGQRLRGSLAGASGADFWRFSATQGTTYIFFADSLSLMYYSMRIYCTDGTTFLTTSGDANEGDAPGGIGLIVWTAPTTANYYLRMLSLAGGTNGGYRIQTGTNSLPGPAAERARDWRDAFVTSSDDGLAWSTPSRMNDDPGYFENWLPEIVVPREGYPYGMWYDWRDDVLSCGGRSHIYSTRSTDGGATWVANQRISDTDTPWSFTGSNIAPNQGDYNGLYGQERVNYSWADGRNGDADVYFAKLDLGLTSACPSDTSIDGGDTGTMFLGIGNPNVTFASQADYTITSTEAWPGFPIVGSTAVNAGGSAGVEIPITVPGAAPAGTNQICVTVQLDNSALQTVCCFDVTVNPTVGVPQQPGAHGLALLGVTPNPSRGPLSISFSLASSARATLEIIDLSGRRVASREVGGLGSGAHTLSLDRDTANLRAGLYAVRLTQGGKVETLKFSLVR